MKEKKHIDRIFQEKLKSFESSPNDAIWERINSELQNDRESRKVIPLWWKMAGIAAGFVLLISLGYFVLNNSSTNTTNVPVQVVDTDVSGNSQKGSQEDGSGTSEENNELNTILNSEDSVSSSESKDSNPDKTDSNASEKSPVSVSEVPKNNGPNTTVKYKATPVVSNTPVAAENNPVVTEVSEKQEGANKNEKDAAPIIFDNATSDAIAENSPKEVPEESNTINNDSSDEIKNTVSTPNKEDMVDGIAISENEATNKDITDEEKSSLEEALAASEDGEDFNEKEKEEIDRWSVTPNVSPVYFNTLGKGSSIHSQFNNNTKKGQLNMAYGVNAAYAVTDKLSVRSGINRVEVGYNTTDVIVYQGLGNSENVDLFRNIDLKEDLQGITIISGETFAFTQVPGIVAQNLKSSLNQDISFIEVPIELEYKLIDKKVGINLIGGGSAMFLNNNSLYTELNNERRLIGEANNINSISYSANFGVGFDVNMSERLSLKLEPAFKYQINTFNNTSGEFKPYIVSIITGLKFKF